MGWLSPYCDQEHMGGQRCPQPNLTASLWGSCHPSAPRDTCGDSSVPNLAPQHPYGVAVTLLLPGTHGDSSVPNPTSQHPYGVTVTLQVPETDRDCSAPNPALQHPYGVAATRDKWDSSVPNPAHPYGVALWGRADPDPMDALASPRARRSPRSWWGSRGGRSFCRWPPGWSRWPTWRSRGPGH